jgi:hypothetical protein
MRNENINHSRILQGNKQADSANPKVSTQVIQPQSQPIVIFSTRLPIQFSSHQHRCTSNLIPMIGRSPPAWIYPHQEAISQTSLRSIHFSSNLRADSWHILRTEAISMPITWEQVQKYGDRPAGRWMHSLLVQVSSG